MPGMVRVPSRNPKRDREIARLRKLLASVERIPDHLREAECADARERDIKAMLADLERPEGQSPNSATENELGMLTLRVKD